MSNTARTKLNKIVREEIAGGTETLDALEKWNKIANRHPPSSESGKLAAMTLADLNAIASSMRDQALEWQKEDRA